MALKCSTILTVRPCRNRVLGKCSKVLAAHTAQKESPRERKTVITQIEHHPKQWGCPFWELRVSSADWYQKED